MKKNYLVIITAASLVYILLAFFRINLPGVQWDELLQAPAAVNLISKSVNGDFHQIYQHVLVGKKVPFMSHSYIGAIKSWYLALVFKIFGISVSVYRGASILITVAGFVVAAFLIRRMYGVIAGVVAITLISTDPSYIFISRSDWGPVAVAFLLRMLTLYVLYVWYEGGARRTGLLALAGVFLGLGVYDKVNFVWFVSSLVAVGIVVLAMEKKINGDLYRQIGIALIFTVASVLPLLVFNIRYGWPTLAFVRRFGVTPSLDGYIDNLKVRIGIIYDFMNGGGMDTLFFDQGLPLYLGVVRTLLPVLFILSISFLVYYAIKSKNIRLLFLPALILLISIQIIISPLRIGMHHWTMIYPFPHIIVGIAAGIQIETFRKSVIARRTAIILVTLLVTVTVAANIRTVYGYYDQLDRTGGVQHWSAEIYNLSDLLMKKYSDRQIQVMDWGLGNNLFFLSKGTLHTHEPFWAYTENPEPDDRLRALANDTGNLFIFNAPEGTLFPLARKAFERARLQTGRSIKSEQRLYDRRGNMVYSIIELR
ncbi:MAG: ArnT family glycosyltransferase [Blastocatellales bacterium]